MPKNASASFASQQLCTGVSNSTFIDNCEPPVDSSKPADSARSTVRLLKCEHVSGGFQSLEQLSGVKPQDLQNGSERDRPPLTPAFDVSCQRRHTLPRRVLQSGCVSAESELKAHRLGRGRGDWRGRSASCLPALGRVWHQAGGKPSCPCSPRSAVPSGEVGGCRWVRCHLGEWKERASATEKPGTVEGRTAHTPHGRLSEAICHISPQISVLFYPLLITFCRPNSFCRVIRPAIYIFKKGK